MKMFIVLCVTIFTAQLVLPWWIIIPISVIVSYLFNEKPWKAFIICFAAIYCVWALYSLYLSYLNGHILANRIGLLLGLPESSFNWIWMTLISGILGGLVAGFAGLSGQYIRKAF
ncbi:MULTISPECIES: hypothetical protein [Olivibacter]|uniref:Transmembrane family 220 protein n=1 Tax=Olivibacter jilunii TaxID=985016 RepID=A0ABW6AVT8_9SPHI|nr:hypothetical protein [Olivibacter sp. UJ_SKK_5.1]MDX3914248.1 hypothetical protein [Pseudosphingobacterium sp.]